MTDKTYKFAAIDIAMQMLRPGATFEISNTDIVRWDDDRPQPTTEEIQEMIQNIKNFEDAQSLLVLTETGETVQVDSEKFLGALNT